MSVESEFMDSKAIGPHVGMPLRPVAGKNAGPAQPVARAKPQGQTKGPDVRLESLRQAREIAAAGPPVEMDKLADLQSRIAQGQYQIQPEAIADAMIRMDLA